MSCHEMANLSLVKVKFEVEVPNGSKVVAFTINYQIFKFQCQLDLEGQGQGHQFSNRYSNDQIFCKFEGQYDLEGQGQGHQFSN